MPLLTTLLLILLVLPSLMAIVAMVRLTRLTRRVTDLETALARLTADDTLVESARAEPLATPSHPGTMRPAEKTPPPADAWQESNAPDPGRGASQQASWPDRVIHRLAEVRGKLGRWLNEGNLPVKIGILVLFAGLAALIRHASTQGWLTLSVELRLAGITLLAVAALGVGWRQRRARRVFALSLQGGAIGVLLMVIFAAAQRFELLPLPLAFALSVALVAGLGVLGAVQNTQALAVLGSLAGFLAPLWLTRSPGDPLVLFGYYALLNLGIFAIAWVRHWRLLDMLGFVATFAIATAWGVLEYTPRHFAVAQPFLGIFFLLYLMIPILHARRDLHGCGEEEAASPGRGARRVNGSLVFGTPLLAFGLQAALLEGSRFPLALCALGVALLYALFAAGLTRRAPTRLLGESHAALALGFATLAIPLALSARVSAGLLAMEGVALIWLALRQSRLLPRLAGLALQLIAGITLLGSLLLAGTTSTPLANAAFMAGGLIAAAGLVSAELLWRTGQPRWALGDLAWGLAWWLGIVNREIEHFAPPNLTDDWRLALLALTGLALAERYRRRPAAPLAWCIAGGLLLSALSLAGALERILLAPHVTGPLAPWGWALVMAFGYRQLQGLARHTTALNGEPLQPVAWAQGAWLWCAPLFLSTLLLQPLPLPLAPAWQLAAATLPWLALAALLRHHPGWLLRPLSEPAMAWRGSLSAGVLLMLVLAWVVLLLRPGTPSPLPWLPFANPLALVQWAALLLAWQLWRGGFWPAAPARLAPVLLGSMAFILLTVELLRGAHLAGGAPWSPAMLELGLVQTGLTLLWSLLGVAGWVLGSRRRQRTLWRLSALLMAVVLVKLVVVDRQHLGNLLGIASFIGYGLLCIGVGYFAPAPPRRQEKTP
ncbi:DUF2339 domain-containing protein [Halomonas icarae]|uniref:DUF2339 domain-containing protein n=1 Tax=Halomonas icarae TaxID=2691040 RepID=A0A7X4VXP0_9GAMM|nr:DUF2339 domain-containing protein [Halomonas icarae]MDR5902262.1 DUF2339 domain-containing protein [Halomonas icarae]NAW12072.1 DUF2339 domain-containing protein [Halomonas icarae]